LLIKLLLLRRPRTDPPLISAVVLALAIMVVGGAFMALQWRDAKIRAERSAFRPVQEMHFEQFRCGSPLAGEDPDAMLPTGWMVKTLLNDDDVPRVAHIRDLIVYDTDPHDIIFAIADSQLETRVHGKQAFAPFYSLPGLCKDGEPVGWFEVHTVHLHPLDPTIELRQGWGPFGPGAPKGLTNNLY